MDSGDDSEKFCTEALGQKERGETMITKARRCFSTRVTKRSTRDDAASEELKEIIKNGHGIIDHKLVLMAGAKAAVASGCDPCLKEIVHELEETGVVEEDIRRAVESGQLSSTYAGPSANVFGHAFESECGDEPTQFEQ